MLYLLSSLGNCWLLGGSACEVLHALTCGVLGVCMQLVIHLFATMTRILQGLACYNHTAWVLCAVYKFLHSHCMGSLFG